MKIRVPRGREALFWFEGAGGKFFVKIRVPRKREEVFSCLGGGSKKASP